MSVRLLAKVAVLFEMSSDNCKCRSANSKRPPTIANVGLTPLEAVFPQTCRRQNAGVCQSLIVLPRRLEPARRNISRSLSQTASFERYISRDANSAGSGSVPPLPNHNNNSDPLFSRRPQGKSRNRRKPTKSPKDLKDSNDGPHPAAHRSRQYTQRLEIYRKEENRQ